MEAKGSIIGGIGAFEPPGKDGDERDNIEGKVGRMKLTDIRLDWSTIICTSKVCNIGRHVSDREVIHSFIKSGMCCNFNA